MISTTQLRFLRTSTYAYPPILSLRVPRATGPRPIRRHLPPSLPPTAPRAFATTTALQSATKEEASRNSTPTRTLDTQSRPSFSLAPTAANPPATTRPPPLNLPVRNADQGTFSFYFATGKAYLTFYKTGLKHIYLNTRLVWSLDAAAGVPRDNTTAITTTITTPSPTRAVGSTTRATFLLRRRWRYDVRRLPLFALLLLICGEFTPFVVAALPNLVPYTCRIPRQIETMRKATEARRAASFARLYTDNQDGLPASTARLANAHVAAHIARSLNLVSPVWDRLGLPDAAVALLLSARRRAARHVALLREDDALLVQAGGVDALDREEVVLACVDRAMGTVARDDEELRARLREWLRYVPEQRDAAAQVQLVTDRLLTWRD